MKIVACLLSTVLMALPLGACATTDPAALSAADQQSCVGYGFKPGTDAFAQCRLQLAQQHQTENDRETDRIRGALHQFGRELAAPPPAPHMLSCRTSAPGFYGTTTTCM